MTFSNILDRIESKLIGLKFVGSSISPDIWIGIIIECFHGFENTFVTIDVLIINVIYGKVTIRLPLICWRLIWSCPVDLVFLSFDIANIPSAECTGWGLHNEDFLVIRECVLSCLACPSNRLVWCLCFTSLYVSSPGVAKKLLKVLALMVGFLKFHMVCFDFPGTIGCRSRFQLSLGFFKHYWVLHDNAAFFIFYFDNDNDFLFDNDHFLFFEFCFLLQFGSIIYDWFVFMTQDIFPIDFIFYGFCHPSGKWPFY